MIDVGDILLLGLTFLLALAACWLLLNPFFKRGPLTTTELASFESGDHRNGYHGSYGTLAQLADNARRRKDRALTALVDLENDFATGKISESDYRRERTQLVGTAATALAELEAMQAPPAESAETRPTSATDAPRRKHQ